MQEVLARLKLATGVSRKSEMKLRNVREQDYFNFLIGLGKLNGVLFTVAADAGSNRVSDVLTHQENQAAEITKHKNVMLHEDGRRAVKKLSDQVRWPLATALRANAVSNKFDIHDCKGWHSLLCTTIS